MRIWVAELDSIAEVCEPPSSDHLHGGLVCYARAVIHDQWPAMRNGRSSDLVQSWIDEVNHEWFDQQAQRREARRERLSEATPLVPVPLWLVLGIAGEHVPCDERGR